jgi:hypothetical protein
MDCIGLVQDRNQRVAVANTVWTFRFHKMLGISLVAAQIAAFQEGLSFMESVRTVKNYSCVHGEIKAQWNLGGSFDCSVRRQLSSLSLPVTLPVINVKKTSVDFKSASELYRSSDRRLSAKLVPTFAVRGCRVVSATDPHGHILGFLDRSRYYFFQVAPQLYSRGWVDPLPDPLLLRKSGSAGNRTRDLWICSKKLWPLDYSGGRYKRKYPSKIQVTIILRVLNEHKLSMFEYMSLREYLTVRERKHQ